MNSLAATTEFSAALNHTGQWYTSTADILLRSACAS